MQTTLKGYKVFNPDFTCLDYQFEEGKEYKLEGKIRICNHGFHFCTEASHCFSYYSFDSKNIVCEVEALGEVQTHDGDSKACTNHIRIVRRLTWEEVLKIVNTGCDNTGFGNSGDSNSGDSNSGDSNSGNSNSGNWNSGDRNSGDSNSGNSNSGDRNSGDRNSGDRNSGDRNSGDRNSGDRNSGNRNSGDRNSGDWNSGNSNSGYSNSGNWNTGAFCTQNAPFSLFDKPSDWTAQDFLNSRAYYLMSSYVETKMWIYSEQMTAEEKAANPSHETTGGYLKDIPFKEAFQNAWGNWDKENRQAFTSLPNFDAEKFESITGVKI